MKTLGQKRGSITGLRDTGERGGQAPPPKKVLGLPPPALRIPGCLPPQHASGSSRGSHLPALGVIPDLRERAVEGNGSREAGQGGGGDANCPKRVQPQAPEGRVAVTHPAVW